MNVTKTIFWFAIDILTLFGSLGVQIQSKDFATRNVAALFTAYAIIFFLWLLRKTFKKDKDEA